MDTIEKSYLEKAIRDYKKRARLDLQIFSSLVGRKDVGEYDRLDYLAFFSHLRDMMRAVTLVDIYSDKFNKRKFSKVREGLCKCISESEEMLIELLTK